MVRRHPQWDAMPGMRRARRLLRSVPGAAWPLTGGLLVGELARTEGWAAAALALCGALAAVFAASFARSFAREVRADPDVGCRDIWAVLTRRG